MWQADILITRLTSNDEAMKLYNKVFMRVDGMREPKFEGLQLHICTIFCLHLIDSYVPMLWKFRNEDNNCLWPHQVQE